jgi:hypothetical protein
MSVVIPVTYDPKPRWYNLEGEDSAKSVFGLVHDYDKSSANYQQTNLKNLRLYSNRELQSLNIANFVLSGLQDMTNGTSSQAMLKPNRLTLNVVKSCIDTLYSKVGKQRIKPTFLTSGGAYAQQTRAKQLSDFMFGLFHGGGMYEIAPMAFKDSLIFGTGFIKVIKQKSKIIFERVMPDEIVVDFGDGYYGKPRSMYQRKFMTKEALYQQFPKLKNIIASAPVDRIDGGCAQTLDVVQVIEAWHLGDDGKHVIALESGMLFEEEYKLAMFPFAQIHYTEPTVGYWGIGLSEDLQGIQIELNRLLISVQESMRRLAQPRIFLEQGSKVNPRHINNEIGTIVSYVGTPPIFQTPSVVSPEITAQIENLYNKAFQVAGISQLSAQSVKPAGINSGRALQEYNDIETERFARTVQQYEMLYIDVAHIVCALLENSPSFTVSAWSRDNGVQKITYGDVKVPKDEYVVQCFPTSMLPKTPAARLSTVQEMMNSGIIDSEIGMDLLDFPDLDAAQRYRMGPMKLARKQIEAILFEGKDVTPEPYMNLQMTLKLAQELYCWSLTVEIPDTNREKLQGYIDSIITLQNIAAETAIQSMPANAPAQGALPQQQNLV